MVICQVLYFQLKNVENYIIIWRKVVATQLLKTPLTIPMMILMMMMTTTGGDETAPFIPQTSTPYSHGGENIEMQTTHHETSGLPQKSYVETSFGAQKTSEAAWVAAKNLFPNMSSSELEVSYDTKGRLQVNMVLAKNCTVFCQQTVKQNKSRSTRAFRKK